MEMSRFRPLHILAAAVLMSCSDGDTTSSSSSSSGMGGMGGTGGTGGTSPGCMMAEECPGVETECRRRSCDGGVCGFYFEPPGYPPQKQTESDCKIRVCDGNGLVLVIPDELDPLDDNNPCTEDSCDAGTPVNSPSIPGAPCAVDSGTLCDGSGQCVECLSGEDCGSGVCQQNICVPPSCIDTIKNGSETDDDCGGADCAPCGDGKICATSSDCQSKVCTAGTCAAPTCSDQAENGVETDVDCGGGVCDPCGPGKGCTVDVDCIGGACSGSTCLPTCTDGVANADETDVDCGGPACAKCDPGQDCSVGSDCTSEVCTNGTCAGPTCNDGQMNGTETGIDCGSNCPPCGDGQPCLTPADCQSGVCTGLTCQVPTCGDVVRNGTETDVDCGGGVCLPCGPGMICVAATDCQSGACPAGICPSTSCGDGAVNGTDTCDDGNQNGGDGCSAVCTVEQGYACAGAPSACSPMCGDGLVRGGETCDDGNTTAGDGCSVTCVQEQGYACVSEPSACGPICGDGLQLADEVCDDGNLADGDCCSSACTVEFGCEIEPNNTVMQADAHAPLAQAGAIKAGIKPIGDTDLFRINVTDVIDLRIETFEGYASGSCPAADTFIELLMPDGVTSLAADDDDGIAKCSLIDPSTFDTGARGLLPGTYYVRVSNTSNSAVVPAYNIALTVAALCGDGLKQGSEQCDDANVASGDGCDSTCKLESIQETEANNVCTMANGPYSIQGPNGALLAGAIMPVNDMDWFSFSVPATADVVFETFDASGPGSCISTDTEIQLFSSDCVTALGAPKDLGGLGACAKLEPMNDTQVRHIPAGIYRLRVNEFGGDAVLSGYTLRAMITALCGNGIAEGFEECDGGAQCDNNCDRMPSCGDGFIDVPEGCDDGNLVNGDGCSMTCTVEAGYGCGYFGGPCLAICGNGVTTGAETCDDSGVLNGDGCDSACFQESSPSLEVEPNDTFANADTRAVDATPILIASPSSTISGSIGAIADKDIYKMTLASAAVVRLETFDGTGGSCAGGMTTTLRLHDAAMLQIGTDNSSGIASCSAYVSYLPAGTYYVQVEETGNNATLPSYKLQVKVESDMGSESENNEPYVRADNLVGSDVVVLGHHQTNNDSDFYAVTVPVAGRAIRAEVIEGGAEACESNGIDSRLTLYSLSGNILVDDNDDGRGLCSQIDGTGGALAKDVSARNLAAGTYFLEVRASSSPAAQTGPSGQFDYRLVVTIR